MSNDGVGSVLGRKPALHITERVSGSGRLAPPFVPTFGPSRRLLAHPPRQTSGSETPDSLDDIGFFAA